MEITVLFFGVLAEVTKTSMKTYQGVNSFRDLNLRILDDFPSILYYSYRISVNNELTKSDDITLRNGDEIALLPPFAGG
jgi:molybdopterin synthase sulfur carrier subunit